MAHDNLNISRFHTAPASELSAALERAVTETDDEAADGWVALFRNRALRLIRNGSSVDLQNEAAILNRYLFNTDGRTLLARAPKYHARLCMIADMVAEAGQRTDGVFLSAVLKSHSRYAQPIVEMLYRNGDGVPRQKILSDLKIPSESYLSHILADLEDANVVIRHRRTGTKGVYLTLGPAGRDMVQEKLLPKWVTRMTTMIADAYDERKVPSPASVTSALEKASAPSPRLLASHVSTLLVKVAGRERPAKEAAAAAETRAR